MAVKILMVDDEPDLQPLVLQKFRKQIRAGTFAFVFALNGGEALQRLQEQPDIDLVLTDINMPVMDGLTLLARIGEMPRLLKTIIVSAYDDMPNIRRAMNRGAYDFLTKPIDFHDVEATIEKTQQELELIRQGLHAREQLSALQLELNVAIRIQQSLLPPPIAGRDEFEISAAMLPARQVSGDFYDFFLIDDDRLGIAMADVSGKGIPAALFMAVSRTLLCAIALQGDPPDRCLHHVNRILTGQSDSEVFVTLFYAVLNLKSGELVYSVGGQVPPYLLSPGKPVQVLSELRGMMLGLFDEAEYGLKTAQLEPVDSLFLYTDGVTEAENSEKETFSEARLGSVLARCDGSSSEHLVNEVTNELKSFTAGLVQADDITILAVRYKPQPNTT